MGSKHQKMTNEKITAMIIEGYGQGEGEAYKPWLEVTQQSLNSQGNRIPDFKSGRIYQCLSALEADFCRCLIWNDDVIDIREQYPLFPVEETEEIARALKIRYPVYPITKASVVMTTDFLVTLSINGNIKLVAISVKYQNEIENNSRSREKQAIEANYWAARGIEWKIVTENSFSRIEAQNIAKLFGAYNFPLENCMSSDQKDWLANRIVERLFIQSNERVSKVCQNIDDEAYLERGTSLTLFMHLCARKQIPVFLNIKLLPTNIVQDTVNLAKLQEMIKMEDFYDNKA